MEEIAHRRQISDPHYGRLDPEPDRRHLSRETRDDKEIRLARPGVVEGAYPHDVEAAACGLAAEQLRGGLRTGVGGARSKGRRLVERAGSGRGRRVLVRGSDQQDARRGHLGLDGAKKRARSDEVQLVAGPGFLPGACDAAHGGQMDHRVRGLLGECPAEPYGVGDVDLAVGPDRLMARGGEHGEKLLPDESGGAGHEDPHARSLPDPRASGNDYGRDPVQACGLLLTRPRVIGDHGAMIIGVAGRNGAGKGEFVRFLETRSFTVLSLSDAIRKELADRGVVETRERMIETGQEMRRKAGPGALAQGLVKQLLPDRNYAIDSIRHPVEVEILRNHAQTTGHAFHLVWVDAKLETRFDRMVARGRSGDPASVGELERLEERERGSEDPNAQQLDAVEAEASVRLTNDSSLDEFQRQIQSWVGANLGFSRPDWDEYFMGIARVVATRSNCVKRKVAAVVTSDKRIISTGYNGTPRGTTNCNEGGCPRCNDLAPGGTRLDECLCSHAEENSITQAAYHGVTLKGGTIYTTFSPCLQCTKMIINAGLAEVIFQSDYPLGEISLALLEEAGVATRQIELS